MSCCSSLSSKSIGALTLAEAPDATAEGGNAARATPAQRRRVDSRPVRILLVGGGCRGLALTRELVTDGHAVRAVTRSEARRQPIEATGAECWIGDPDVVGTLRYALENVTILVWALGTASGTPAAVAALHGSRLEMMLSRTIDSTVRGVVYEAAGTVAREAFATGIAQLERVGKLNEIPYAIVDADPADRAAWVAAARHAIDRLAGVDYDQLG
jgi:hypothetical protein